MNVTKRCMGEDGHYCWWFYNNTSLYLYCRVWPSTALEKLKSPWEVTRGYCWPQGLIEKKIYNFEIVNHCNYSSISHRSLNIVTGQNRAIFISAFLFEAPAGGDYSRMVGLSSDIDPCSSLHAVPSSVPFVLQLAISKRQFSLCHPVERNATRCRQCSPGAQGLCNRRVLVVDRYRGTSNGLIGSVRPVDEAMFRVDGEWLNPSSSDDDIAVVDLLRFKTVLTHLITDGDQ